MAGQYSHDDGNGGDPTIGIDYEGRVFQILGGKPGTPFGIGCWGTNTTTGYVQVGSPCSPCGFWSLAINAKARTCNPTRAPKAEAGLKTGTKTVCLGLGEENLSALAAKLHWQELNRVELLRCSNRKAMPRSCTIMSRDAES